MTCFVTHLECANCCERYAADQAHGLCVKCQKPLWVRYDLDAVRSAFAKGDLAGRASTMWRYRELLPIQDAENIVSLGRA
jgi:threonine synthase